MKLQGQTEIEQRAALDAMRDFLRELTGEGGPMRIAETDDGDWLVCLACRDTWPKTGNEHHYERCLRRRALALLGEGGK